MKQGGLICILVLKKKEQGNNLKLALFLCYVIRDAITCRTKLLAGTKFGTDE